MKISAYLRDTRTGDTKVYMYECQDPSWADYQWKDGNDSCDCNRSRHFFGFSMYDEDPRELECNNGPNIIALDKLVNDDTGEILLPYKCGL